uniref:Uncharacterized protein n=1 Tax=Equus caballus TaxID=9796 RepID=A0A3Q2IDS6_HORSE
TGAGSRGKPDSAIWRKETRAPPAAERLALSARFSLHFFTDADSSARGDSTVLFSWGGITIPFKFLDGNLAGLADRPPPAGETGASRETPLRPCARCRRPKFHLCRVTPLTFGSPWEG